MAKRKAAAAATKRAKTRRTGVAATRARAARVKATPKRRAKAGKPARAAKKAPVTATKAAAARKPAARKAARKVAARKPAPRLAKAVKKAPARKALAPKKVVVQKKAAAPKKALAPKGASAPRKAAAPARPAAPKAPAALRKAPALDRARRTISDDDTRPSPPSSLDLDRTASSARSGRHELARHHLEESQADLDITAGDVDADAASAYSVGDEAPGGDNPTPDQDVVDEIGQALGMVYEDAEELDGEGKISGRDTDRWELDPESSEDFDERD